ncbi:hypothetical protein EZV61_14050 [Corallincola luteus]|uniref:Uncharacterized protein n=1 Tax=Corallincola luteus TaxID=1775177 RepID=A0ABY2AJS3_9GAMM|nr:hypothetical protein [Corallincola luteus]TCI02473.1 hypothetical protein EZV61_14050 [Corallincola luteus]
MSKYASSVLINVLYLGLGLLFSFSAQAFKPEPPERVPGLGVAVPDSDIDNKLKHYCRPIAAWSRPAYMLCLEAGVSVNLAIREYHAAECSAQDTRGICEQARGLYQRNFRLWDGSVDNVGRAQAQLGAAGRKKVAASAGVAQCKNRYQQAIDSHRTKLDQILLWLEQRKQVTSGLSAESLLLLERNASEKLSLSGFKPPVSSPTCQQAMKGSHAKLVQEQSEIRKQLSAKQVSWRTEAERLLAVRACEQPTKRQILALQQQYLQSHQSESTAIGLALLQPSGFVFAKDNRFRFDRHIADLAKLAVADPNTLVGDDEVLLVQQNCSVSSELQLQRMAQTQRQQWFLLQRDLWVVDYLAAGKRLPELTPSNAKVWLFSGLGLLFITIVGVCIYPLTIARIKAIMRKRKSE